MIPSTMAAAIECIRVKIAGAVYSVTDMLVFEVYKKISEDRYYLVATMQEDEINEKICAFEWDKVPEDIMNIYEYVSATSVMEIKGDMCILYGNHIGRRQNHKYVLAKYLKNPCQADTLELLQMHQNCNTVATDLTDLTDLADLLQTYSDIWQNTKIVKNL